MTNMPKLKTKKKIKTIKPSFAETESNEMTEEKVDDAALSKAETSVKPRTKARKKSKTIRPNLKKSESTKKPESVELSEDEVADLQDIVLSKPDATAKPKLHTAWPVLLVVSILTCIGIPFIPSAERLLLGSFVLCAAIWSTYKIFRYEKDIHQWFIDNPEFAKKKKLRTKNRSRNRVKDKQGKPIKVKI